MKNKAKKRIHFVCTGNVFRSRLAEACFNMKCPEGWYADSSGIHANADWFGPIAPWTKSFAEAHGWGDYLSGEWQQTTCEMLQESELVVFIQPVHKVWAERNCDISEINYKVWDIADKGSRDLKQEFRPDSYQTEGAYVTNKIMKHVDMLLDS